MTSDNTVKWLFRDEVVNFQSHMQSLNSTERKCNKYLSCNLIRICVNQIQILLHQSTNTNKYVGKSRDNRNSYFYITKNVFLSICASNNI